MSSIEARYLTQKKERCIRSCKLVYRGVPYVKHLEQYCEERCNLQHG